MVGRLLASFLALAGLSGYGELVLREHIDASSSLSLSSLFSNPDRMGTATETFLYLPLRPGWNYFSHQKIRAFLDKALPRLKDEPLRGKGISIYYERNSIKGAIEKGESKESSLRRRSLPVSTGQKGLRKALVYLPDKYRDSRLIPANTWMEVKWRRSSFTVYLRGHLARPYDRGKHLSLWLPSRKKVDLNMDAIEIRFRPAEEKKERFIPQGRWKKFSSFSP